MTEPSNNELPEHHEPATPRYGVAQMTPEQLSNKIEQLEAEDNELEAAGQQTSSEPFNALCSEIANLLRSDYNKGRELCLAMVKSAEPNDRRLIAWNITDLIEAERGTPYTEREYEDGVWCFAELLANEDGDAEEAARLALDDAVSEGRLSTAEVVRVIQHLVDKVDALRARPM